MFCSTSIGMHLLKGLGAVLLIGGALYLGVGPSANGLLSILLLIGAVVLLRGCPMCWLMGLFDTIANRKAKRLAAKPPSD
ncbi:MAG: hypothetical protein KA214_05350 [Neisseriaceae bacterium]|nr:hypothetical protein [Neisseriaceae bacterium]